MWKYAIPETDEESSGYSYLVSSQSILSQSISSIDGLSSQESIKSVLTVDNDNISNATIIDGILAVTTLINR